MTHAESINPYDGAVIQRFERHDDGALDARLDAAVAAQRAWRGRSLGERAQMLRRAAALLEERRDRLARLATVEMGKLLAESTGEVEKCAWVCRYYADSAAGHLAPEPLPDEATRKSYVLFQPLGVLLAIMPWNFPFWQAFRAAAPALMAGNAVVLKHASNVTACALAMEQRFADAGLPEGLFAVIVTSGRRASELIGDPRVAAVTLTGSEGAGSAVGGAAGKALKPSVLELGGSDAFVVLDLERGDVVSAAVQARFMNAGQSCIAAKRYIVVEAVYDRFVEALLSAVEGLRLGDPLHDTTTLAPMARRDLREEVHGQVQRAQEAGASLLAGGVVPDGPGAAYPATVLAGLPRDADVYREEIFGPVATVFRVADLDEAVAVANDSPYGLGGSVWSGDLERAIEAAHRIDSGAVYVNRIMASDPRLPFGGIKRSGYGRELARQGIRSFVNEKTVSIALGSG